MLICLLYKFRLEINIFKFLYKLIEKLYRTQNHQKASFSKRTIAINLHTKC